MTQNLQLDMVSQIILRISVFLGFSYTGTTIVTRAGTLAWVGWAEIQRSIAVSKSKVFYIRISIHLMFYILILMLYRGADDLLPIICYIVMKSELPQIFSQCSIMEEFIPSE